MKMRKSNHYERIFQHVTNQIGVIPEYVLLAFIWQLTRHNKLPVSFRIISASDKSTITPKSKIYGYGFHTSIRYPFIFQPTSDCHAAFTSK